MYFLGDACTDDASCQGTDSNMVCSDDKSCVCKDGYFADTSGNCIVDTDTTGKLHMMNSMNLKE